LRSFAAPTASTFRWMRSRLTMCARSHRHWLSPARHTLQRRSPPLRAPAQTSSCSVQSSKPRRNGVCWSREEFTACQRRLSSGFRWLRWEGSHRRTCRRACVQALPVWRAFAPFWLQPIRALRPLRFLLILPRENKFQDKTAPSPQSTRRAVVSPEVAPEVAGASLAECRIKSATKFALAPRLSEGV
jgi:hypothetical protein